MQLIRGSENHECKTITNYSAMDQQDADGTNEEGSSVPQEQSSAEQLKAEGVVGFYGQKSPSAHGQSIRNICSLT